MVVVSNAGPLIALARIGELGLIRRYFKEIRIANEVYNEICIRGKDKAGAIEISEAKWIISKMVKDKFAAEILEMELNRGEAETIILAKESNARVVLMDERIPRDMLRSLGFKIIGTVGILIKAARENRLNLRKTLDKLRNKGVWLSDKLYDEALNLLQTKRN